MEESAPPSHNAPHEEICNIPNRTIFCHDNLEVLRGINSGCIDLIYLDPPFNKKKSFFAPTGSNAKGAGFKDVFYQEEMQDEWVQTISEENYQLSTVLNAMKSIEQPFKKSNGTNKTASNYCYLCYMAVRLIEMHRVLKKTGALYLHCDSTMSHFLKILLDIIFGEKNFRNEIIWKRATAHNDARKYGSITDTIFFYTKDTNYVWNGTSIAERKSEEELQRDYPSTDMRGNYRVGDLTGPLHGNKNKETPSNTPWKNYDVFAMGRCWSVPKTGHYANYIDTHLLPGYLKITDIHARLDALDRAHLIHHPKGKGKWPGLKRYAAADFGILPQNLILTPIGFTNYNKTKEYVDYPTQKPLALVERFIAASSNAGDTVLDPFCGCATTCVASEKLGRQWIGVDISIAAYELVKIRLEKEVWNDPDALHKYSQTDKTGLPASSYPAISFSTDPSQRTDSGDYAMNTKYVYIISHPHYPGEYKVGIASNVHSRLNAYQTSDPNRQYKLEYFLETAHYREIEAHIHHMFSNKHEWVQADLQEIKTAMKEIESNMSKTAAVYDPTQTAAPNV